MVFLKGIKLGLYSDDNNSGGIIKVEPDGSSYVVVDSYQPHIEFRINSYRDLWTLTQLKDVYDNEVDGKDYFWEFIPLVLRKERYNVEIRQCQKSDIMEIDNYYELAQLDPTYKEV